MYEEHSRALDIPGEYAAARAVGWCMTNNTQVYQFNYRGHENKRMRLVVAPDDGTVVVEVFDGKDALGTERWQTVDLSEEDDYGDPVTHPCDWVAMAVLAVVRGEQS